jgi:hypothetical protein
MLSAVGLRATVAVRSLYVFSSQKVLFYNFMICSRGLSETEGVFPEEEDLRAS